MNVFRYEVKRYVPSSIVWAFSLTFFGIVCIQLFVVFSAQVSFFENMLNAYSPEMLKAFGAELSTIKTLPGFYSFCFMYVVVAAAFQAMYLGMHVVGKEMSEKTGDFLYTKPISRMRVLTNKLGAIIACLLLVNIIYGIGTLISAVSTNLAFDQTMFFTMNSSMFLTQFLFFSLGFLIACVMKKIKSPLSFTAGLVSAFFLFQMIVNVEPDGILSYLSLLNYVSADSILSNGGFEIVKLILLLGLSASFIVSGYYIFQHRDIHTV